MKAIDSKKVYVAGLYAGAAIIVRTKFTKISEKIQKMRRSNNREKKLEIS